MNEKILKLIQFIACYASEQESHLTTTRIIKFIYLADLYFARWNNGKTFTKLPWAFVYYGPYCSEAYRYVEDAVHKGLISRQTYSSSYPDSKDFHLFSCTSADSEIIEKKLPIEVVSGLKAAIKKYGDDTAQLLDHVYFETEPMESARKGQILDFSTARLPQFGKSIKINKLSKESIDTIKKHLKLLGDNFKKGRENLLKDDRDTDKWRDNLFYQTLAALDEEALPEGLEGTARIIE